MIFMFAACRKQDLVDEKTFVECYAQILVIKSSTADSLQAGKGVDSVLASNNVTKDQMQRQLAMYVEDGDRYGRILEQINRRLRAVDSVARIQNPESRIQNGN